MSNIKSTKTHKVITPADVKIGKFKKGSSCILLGSGSFKYKGEEYQIALCESGICVIDDVRGEKIDIDISVLIKVIIDRDTEDVPSL